MSVGEDAEHDVVSGGVMDEGPFGVDKEDIRHPDLFHQAAIEGHALVGGAGEGQPLILPVVPQIQGHGEVLGEEGWPTETQTASGLILACSSGITLL